MILTGAAPSMTIRWEPFADEVSLFALGPAPFAREALLAAQCLDS